MVKKILKWVLVAMVLSLVALWIWQGGYWKIANYAQILPNPLRTASSSDYAYMLPGQQEFSQVPETTYDEDDYEYGAADYENPHDQLYDATDPVPQTYAPSEYGERSRFAGSVTLRAGTPEASDPRSEYLMLRAVSTLPSSINLSGWSLQSVLSKQRVVIPLAASPFVQGVVNSVDPIILRGGETVILSSGPSPLGVSFRESSCTGYLAQSQNFTPPLPNTCARPADVLPRTAENEARYGTACFDYIERIPNCSYPTTFPSHLTGACRSHLASTFTYNGCALSSQGQNSQSTYAWRAYFASGIELWGNTHDTIRLLDESGRIVDVMSY